MEKISVLCEALRGESHHTYICTFILISQCFQNQNLLGNTFFSGTKSNQMLLQNRARDLNSTVGYTLPLLNKGTLFCEDANYLRYSVVHGQTTRIILPSLFPQSKGNILIHSINTNTHVKTSVSKTTFIYFNSTNQILFNVYNIKCQKKLTCKQLEPSCSEYNTQSIKTTHLYRVEQHWLMDGTCEKKQKTGHKHVDALIITVKFVLNITDQVTF